MSNVFAKSAHAREASLARPQKPVYRHLNLNLTQEDYEWVKGQAYTRDVRMAQVLRDLIAQARHA